MAFAKTFGMVNGNGAARFLGKRLQRTIRAAAGPGFRAMLTGRGIIDDEWSIHEPHQGVGIVFAVDGIQFVRRKPHGNANLIGDPMPCHPIAEFFTDQASDLFASFGQCAVPGSLGDFIQDSRFEFQYGQWLNHGFSLRFIFYKG